MRTYITLASSLALALPCLGQDGMRLDTEFGWVNDAKQERVKVELSSPVSYKASVSNVKPAEPAAFNVKYVEPAKEADPVKSDVPYVFAAVMAKANRVDVPTVFAEALAKVDQVDVPAVFEAAIAKMEFSRLPAVLAVALEKATDAQVPYIVAAMYAELVRATVKNCQPVDLAKIKAEWYEKFHAKGGSKMWWILRVAKMRAERGEDVSSLKKAFDETMNKWILED